MAARSSYEDRGLEELTRELVELDGQIEAAAVEEDLEAFIRLRMRQAALPALIRDARAEPIRGEVEQLEGELERLDAEAEYVREAPAPEVPERHRGHVTPLMLRNRALAGVLQRQHDVGKDLAAARRELASIEAESGRQTSLLV